MSAIEVDAEGYPTKILSSVSHIHDSGLDPDNIKSAMTRLAVSGVARRTRRLYRRKRKRLVALDRLLTGFGWPLPNLEDYPDPYFPWKARTELATNYIANEEKRSEYLSIALRHIARHRGWRNPYTSAHSLVNEVKPSDAFVATCSDVSSRIGVTIDPLSTPPGTLVYQAIKHGEKIRGEAGILSARLHQSDHAQEILKICKTQRLDDAQTREIIEAVFKAESPKGASAKRAGQDPLQPQHRRALKASLAFQRYRIAALTGNLRIRESSGVRRLSLDEQLVAFDFLANYSGKSPADWVMLADKLGIDRGQLVGTATMTDDGERAGNRPPINETARAVANSKIKPLVSWWKIATDAEREEMIRALSNGEEVHFDSRDGAPVQEFFAGLSDEDQSKLDTLRLPIGRAAYSAPTLERITNRILSDGMDLYEARRAEFGVSKDWAPPAPHIGAPVGNPAVDRVLKEVSRWLEAAISEWGAPLSVNIEHVRAAFVSEHKAREMDRDNNKRAKRNQELFASMQENLGVKERPRRADLWRYQSVQRQNGQCAYCGQPITMTTCEMDHIVPRAGQGSTNIRENLVAVCKRCNLSKGKTPFAVWAESSTVPGVSVAEALERTKHWVADSGLSTREFNRFRNNVARRLTRSSLDEELDARSIESVAWMANELRGRISQRLDRDKVPVYVYRGAITAEARRASGIEKRIVFIGGTGKSRLDRRHHAVDAAIVAFVSNYVAEVLAQRSNLKFSQELRREAQQWKEYSGADPAHRAEWNKWLPRMHRLADLLQDAIDKDEIVVKSNLRLRLGNGSVHEDTIGPLARKPLGSEFSCAEVDRAASEALWCALTRSPDYVPGTGLPANPDRTIQVNGTRIHAGNDVELFPVNAGAIAIRGGYAELGSSFHHARFYRIKSGTKYSYAMLRVYRVDLQRFRNEDLFTVELPLQTMSVRQCEPKLRQALADQTAEYIGWLVVDDELMLDTSAFSTGQIAKAQEITGQIHRWRVDGFFSNSKLRLRPLQLSAEGLNQDAPGDLVKVVDSPGWRPAVNKLFSNANVSVVRRDALGRPRLESHSGLPTSWSVGAHESWMENS